MNHADRMTFDNVVRRSHALGLLPPEPRPASPPFPNWVDHLQEARFGPEGRVEGDAWMSRWCSFCVHDHDMHEGQESRGGCPMIIDAMVGGPDWRWPEAWTPEPPGWHGLPSWILCGQFSPCCQDQCTGDPAPEERAERVATVQAAWRAAG